MTPQEAAQVAYGMKAFVVGQRADHGRVVAGRFRGVFVVHGTKEPSVSVPLEHITKLYDRTLFLKRSVEVSSPTEPKKPKTAIQTMIRRCKSTIVDLPHQREELADGEVSKP